MRRREIFAVSGPLIHSHDEDVDDGEYKEKECANVVQIVNLPLLELFIEVDASGVHQDKTSESGDDDTGGSEADLGVVEVLEQVILVSDDKLELNTVGHDDDEKAEDGHDCLLGGVAVGVKDNWCLSSISRSEGSGREAGLLKKALGLFVGEAGRLLGSGSSLLCCLGGLAFLLGTVLCCCLIL